MKDNTKYSFIDYTTDNLLMMTCCFGFSILLLSVGVGSYSNGNYSDAKGVWVINGMLTGTWILVITIDYYKMKAKAKRGEL